MTDRRADLDRLLYAGEEMLVRVGRSPTEIVVTSHRLLAFTPEAEGANFHAIHRPNVDGIDLDASGRTGLLTGGGKALLVGLVGLLAGLLVDFDGLATAIPSTGTDAVGTGGVLAMLGAFRTAISLADSALFAFGGLLAAAGAVAIAVFWLTRDHHLVVSVAGDEDVRLDAAAFSQSDRSTIESALDRQ
ncbi:MAG: hypothetical protein ABEJ44_06325 [Halanaeroarchaeum sp.]